jgi:hypothetical protein
MSVGLRRLGRLCGNKPIVPLHFQTNKIVHIFAASLYFFPFSIRSWRTGLLLHLLLLELFCKRPRDQLVDLVKAGSLAFEDCKTEA